MYKLHLIKYKKELFFEKDQLEMDLKLETYNIIPLLNHCSEQSFAKVEGNKKAISERGWNPLDYRLLVDPDILRTKGPTINLTNNEATCDNIINATSEVVNDKKDLRFNTAEGYTGQCIAEIFQHEVKVHKIKQNVEGW